MFVAGHWTPQLIELAGGEDVLGLPGEPSRTASWEELAAATPQIVVVMPCGYDAPRAHAEALAYAERLAALRSRSGWSRWTPPRTSRGPGRAWSTGWSCSRTSCTPSRYPSRRARR